MIRVLPGFRNGGSAAANEELVKVDPTEFELRARDAEWAVREAEARLQMERARGEAEAGAFSRENPGVEVSDWVRRVPAIAKAEAKLERARARLALAELDLRRTSISVPYDVRVIRANVGVGEIVGPADRVGASSVLGVAYRGEALVVDAPIEPRDLGYLAPAIGRSARGPCPGRHVRGGSGEGVVGRLSEDPPRVAVPEVPGGIGAGIASLAGTFVEVEIDGPAYENVYVLPESAVQERGAVWVVAGGVLESRVPRELGRTREGRVVEAFDTGEGVVLGALPGARDGLAVDPTAAVPSE